MKVIDLKKYGPIIGSRSVGDEIFDKINNTLETEEKVEVDLNNIKSMATFCAKQIFGKLYLNLGSVKFFERIILKNADKDLRTIIQIGIQHALQENK
jgi:hypothetical protein